MNEFVSQSPGLLILRLDSHVPRIADDAFIAPGAVLIGRVTIGKRSSVWYGSVLRGDDEDITLGADCNVQDGCILHADPGEPAIVGDRVTIGHRAVVHGAMVEADSLIGIGAVVLEGSRVGSGSIIAAGAVVRPGIEIPPNSLVVGVPGEIRRSVTDEEHEMIRSAASEYVTNAQRHAASLEQLPEHRSAE